MNESAWWLQGMNPQQLQANQDLYQMQVQPLYWVSRELSWPERVRRWRERQAAGFDRGELSLPEVLGGGSP